MTEIREPQAPATYMVTLRDYFAALSLQALISNNTDFSNDEIAELAYEFADRMIKERELPK
jgi:hypothetical protein